MSHHEELHNELINQGLAEKDAGTVATFLLMQACALSSLADMSLEDFRSKFKDEVKGRMTQDATWRAIRACCCVSPPQCDIVVSDSSLPPKSWFPPFSGSQGPLFVASHESVVRAIECSRDGTKLVSATGNGELVVWEGLDGSGEMRLLAVFPNSCDSESRIAICPLNKYIVAGGPRPQYDLTVWDLTSTQVRNPRTLRRRNNCAIECLRFDDTGLVLAHGDAMGCIEIRHASQNWQVCRVIEDNLGQSALRCLLFIPRSRYEDHVGDYRQLLCGSRDGLVRSVHVDVSEESFGQVDAELTKNIHVNNKCVFSLFVLVGEGTDVVLVSCSAQNNDIAVWNVDDELEMQSRQERPHDGSPVLCLAACRRRNLVASGSGDGYVKVWSISPQSKELSLLGSIKRAHGAIAVNGVCFHPSGFWLISGGSDRLVKVWTEW